MTSAISSSIAPNFDNLQFLEMVETGFPKVTAIQSFMDARFREQPYLEAYIGKLVGLRDQISQVVLHLPNFPGIAEEHHPLDLRAAKRIYELQTKGVLQRVVALVHYEDWLPGATRVLPVIGDRHVLLENSLTGLNYTFEEHLAHLHAVYRLARSLDTGMVLDVGRMYYANETDVARQLAVISLLRDLIEMLDPALDIIHYADKNSWPEKFGKSGVAYPSGVVGHIAQELYEFHMRGGLLINESENVEFVRAGIKAFEP